MATNAKGTPASEACPSACYNFNQVKPPTGNPPLRPCEDFELDGEFYRDAKGDKVDCTPTVPAPAPAPGGSGGGGPAPAPAPNPAEFPPCADFEFKNDHYRDSGGSIVECLEAP